MNSKGVYGSLSRSFIPRIDKEKFKKRNAYREFRNPDLEPGNRIIHAYLGDSYSRTGPTRKNTEYTLENIRGAILKQGPVILWEQFLEYIYFDCFVGNIDRHHENWGFITYPKTESNPVEIILAPTYDHGPALDSGSKDENKEKILAKSQVEEFYRKGRAIIYIHIDKQPKRAMFPDLIKECISVD